MGVKGAGEMFRKGGERAFKDYLGIFGPAAFFTVLGFIVAYQFVQPAPPKQVVIATGMKEGAYYAYGKSYSEILARDGITLEVLSTAGSAENIKLLEAETGGADVAFVQGGTGMLATADDLVSLGSLYLEPLWLFYRANNSVDQISDLKGMRIAVGKKDSGTGLLAMQLLELNGLASVPDLLISEGGNKAAEMLLEGEVDAAFFVTSHRSSVVKMLLESEQVRLLSFDRVEAYTTRYRFLREVRLPEGVIDFEKNIPSRDIILLAPAAQLVAREGFHPALIDLLLQTAEGIHGPGGLFEEPDEFPSTKYLDFPLDKEARRFYESGPPFLRRHLPFWAATLVDRLKIMLLPLLVLLLPFFKLMPPIYRWRVRSRIYRWYSELEGVDPRLQKDDIAGLADEYLAKLDKIEDKVTRVSIPLSYTEELYQLRLHIEMLRNELRKAGEKNTLPEEKERP
jgi:TRAP transporter TAXI family solute receptor